MKQSSILQSLLLCVLTFFGSLAVPQSVSAQYVGNNFHGDFGVNSGTQSGYSKPPPPVGHAVNGPAGLVCHTGTS